MLIIIRDVIYESLSWVTLDSLTNRIGVKGQCLVWRRDQFMCIDESILYIESDV